VSLLDVLLIALVALATIIGALRGALREALSLFGWALALAVAWLFADSLAPAMARRGDVLFGRLAAFALVFIVVFLAVSVAGFLLRRLVFTAAPGKRTRLAGAALGSLRGLAVALVLVWLAGLTAVARQPAWRESALVPLLDRAAQALEQKLLLETAPRVRRPGR
jgi:membrane protein required for colicin V production